MNIFEPFITAIAFSSIGVIVGAISQFLDRRRNKQSSEAVREAEKRAYLDIPEELEAKIRKLADSQEGLEERTGEIAKLLAESREAVSVGRLFNLYSKQIEQYQQETRSRASWSFAFAIVAMVAGFAFVVWGGTVLLTASEPIALAAGGLLSSVGGAVSGFIAKTFLDVHRLSLTQLNRYFQQPVINDHILMAQRLAEDAADEETRRKAYGSIIASVTGLIDARGAAGDIAK